MKKILLGAAALIAIGAAPALAADLLTPTYTKAPPVAAPVDTWTGFYAGLNAGGDWGTSSDPTSTAFCTLATCYFNAPNVPGVNAAGAQSVNTSGFTGGIQGGYNWQSGNFVAGFEADFEYFRSAGSSSVTAIYPVNAPFSFNINSSVSTDWLFTARPRLGYAANGWLFYGTGGLAVTQLRTNETFIDNCCILGGGFGVIGSAPVSSVKAGWVVGAGIERKLADKWSLGVEYLYVNFGSISTTSANLTTYGYASNVSGSVFSHSADLASNIVRLRLNKQF
jgi:outer membrane immunogenic protein